MLTQSGLTSADRPFSAHCEDADCRHCACLWRRAAAIIFRCSSSALRLPYYSSWLGMAWLSAKRKRKFLEPVPAARFGSNPDFPNPLPPMKPRTYGWFRRRTQLNARNYQSSPPIRRPTTNFTSRLTKNGSLVCATSAPASATATSTTLGARSGSRRLENTVHSTTWSGRTA